MSGLIKDAKRLKLFNESVKEDNLKKELEKVDSIFRASGVETKGDFSDVFVDPKKIKVKSLPEKVKESSNTVNHKQLLLVNEMKELLASGFAQENMKEFFLKRNFKSADIDRALRNINACKLSTLEEVEQIDANGVRNYLKDSENAKSFLKIVEKESLPTTRIYKVLNVSARKGNDLKKELLMFGLIKEVEERNESGWKKFLKLTESGSDLLARS
jgi:predicted transcriptional regulator